MIRWRYLVMLVALGMGLLSSNAVAGSAPLADLPDGSYQFCSEPDPQDWRVGAGACLNFIKQGSTIEGYYGYPHSSEFVCLRGQVSEQVFHGQGAIALWEGETYLDFPEQPFNWGPEGRLSLSQGEIAGGKELLKELLKELPENLENWMFFQSATLNLDGLTAHTSPLMTPPAQLCDGPF